MYFKYLSREILSYSKTLHSEEMLGVEFKLCKLTARTKKTGNADILEGRNLQTV